MEGRQQLRAARRAAMVAAAMDAVRRHGPGVSVAEIAAAAGITKPVLYRHFADRADLQRAVGQEAAAMLLARIAPALATEGDPRAVVSAIVDAFLSGIEDEPELWRFVVHHPVERTPGAEIVDDARAEIARMLTGVLAEQLRAAGRDTNGTAVWTQGLVGMVQSAGDWWLERRPMSRAALTEHLTAIIWGGLAAVLEEDRSDGYAGQATLTVNGRDVPVHALLDARHEPHDGRLHWFGRLRALPSGETAAAPDSGTRLFGDVPAGAEVALDAGAGPVAARLGDVDPWGRVRVTGVGPLPYPVSLPF